MNEASLYINDQLYRSLIDKFPEEVMERSPYLVSECEAFLYREARLLDDGNFGEWINLFTTDCLYWIPANPDGGDPRTEVSISFDDYRRLKDRISRLATGKAHSQIQPSRTRRLLSNVEVWSLQSDSERRVRSNFVVFEHRNFTLKTHTGWYEHVLRRENGVWKIARKRIQLIDCDEAHNNLTFIL